MALKLEWSALKPEIDSKVLDCIDDVFGFKTVMPVQKAAIPYFMKNYDVAV